jgi:hypothetical protein
MSRHSYALADYAERFGEAAPQRKPRGQTGATTERVRSMLYRRWWTCADLSVAMNMGPELVRYHVHRIAREQIVFARRLAGRRKRTRAYRLYQEASGITAAPRLVK